jgi:hypothetical protein
MPKANRHTTPFLFMSPQLLWIYGTSYTAYKGCLLYLVSPLRNTLLTRLSVQIYILIGTGIAFISQLLGFGQCNAGFTFPLHLESDSKL